MEWGLVTVNNRDNSIIPANMDKFDVQASQLNQEISRLAAQCIATDDPRLTK
jgi:hypothetical protein